ncbi:MAG: PP2C family protein-serine/threonine phosphatase [Armatimonadota bacterium]
MRPPSEDYWAVYHPEATALMGADPAPRVLICEDEGLTALRLRRALTALGYHVVGEANNGVDAVEATERLKPDLVMMDVQMPRMSGIEATARIMQSTPVAVLMLTAYSQQELVARALQSGASGYLVKPIDEVQLVPAISLALSRFREKQHHQRATTDLVTQQQRLSQADERIRVLHQELEGHREVARVLTQNLLGEPQAIPGFQVAARYEAASDMAGIGGDFYDFFPLDAHRTVIVLGDVCGHGLEAASYLARAKYMLRAYAVEDPSPSSVLARLNQGLLSSPVEDHRFLTLIYGVLDRRRGTFLFGNGGHPPAYLCHTGTLKCEELANTGGLIGGVADLKYGEQEVTLRPGSLLVAVTDGVTEARTHSDMFGFDRLRALVRSEMGRTADEVADAVLRAARAHGGGELRDDAAVVVLRYPEPDRETTAASAAGSMPS